MPNFRYTAAEASGKVVEGTIASPTLREAAATLRSRGLRVQQVVEESPAISAAVPTASTPAAPTPAAPVRPPAPVSPPIAASSAPARTGYGTEKDTFLVFSQLASYLKSGINPQQAFSDLASRVTREDYRASFGVLRDAAGKGQPVSGAMELYPKLYPPHAVGLMRAGEQAGFLPEAAETIALQAEAAMKFVRPFWFLKRILILAILSIPLALAAVRGALATWSVQEAAGGGDSGLATLAQKFWEMLKWPYGPMIVGWAIAAWIFNLWWRSLSGRIWRHRLALAMPLFGKRARSEGSSLFAWALSHLSKAGLPPNRAWQMALDVIPNLAYRDRLEQAGSTMTERSRLSEAFSVSKGIPTEFALVVQTGEATGDVPGALLNASSMSRTEFEETEPESKRLARSWGCLISVVGWLILMYILYRVFYPGMAEQVLGE